MFHARLERHDMGLRPLRRTPLLVSLASLVTSRRPSEAREAARAAVRDRIMEAIEREPGVSPSRLVATLDIGWSTLYYHLKALAEQGLVRADVGGRHSFLYPAGMVGDDELSAQLAVLRNGRARVVAEEIARRPGHNVASLAEGLGMSPRVVYHYVRRLTEVGLVTSSIRHGYRDLAPAERLGTLLRQEADGS